MTAYLVDVYTFYPYKIGFSYTEKASSHSVAISRAVRQFRSEPRLSKRKYKEVYVKAIRL